jgi:predicted peroxiredoxin
MVAEVELFVCGVKAKPAALLATVTVTEKVAVVPALSFATAVMVWLPSVV